MLYVKGEKNEDLIEEVKRAIECAYPIKDGKKFISIKNVLLEIRDYQEKYPITSKIAKDQYRKSVVTKIIKNDLKWEIRSITRGGGYKNGAVFIRGEL